MPLAEILRPQKVTDFVGQRHLMAPGKPLYQVLKQKVLSSMVFYGPPGVGKTTLARLLAQNFSSNFYVLSAVSANKDTLRQIIKQEEEKESSLTHLIEGAPVIFLDEIHRFNKTQQDYLLPFLESGTIILIGATTENPFFALNSALLSRLQVYQFQPLDDQALKQVLSQVSKYYQDQEIKIKFTPTMTTWLLHYAGGDARRMINLIAQTLVTYQTLTLKNLQTSATITLKYGRASEAHYNTVSALIKSMRASQTEASLYYLARLLQAGETPEYIARRLIIFASEDIGLAVPTALVVANQVYQAVSLIGMPEAQLNLAHGVVYLSQCRKSRQVTEAWKQAQAEVTIYGDLPIPEFLHLHAPAELRKKAQKNQFSFLPNQIKVKKYF